MPPKTAAAAAAALPANMETYAARLETFITSQRLPKRRASNTKKKAPTTATWPHASPTPEELAYAGFFFKPTSTSPDNVQCFLCQRQLDGWEPADQPTYEHLTHSPDCGWAINQAIRIRNGDPNRVEDHPMSEKMMNARRMTFTESWPYEGVENYPQVEELVAAGWFYDPSEDLRDGVTCPYCQLSLDGWEEGDDPVKEHQKRASDCMFFSLVGASEAPQPAKKKRVSRASTAKRASTASTTTKRQSKRTSTASITTTKRKTKKTTRTASTATDVDHETEAEMTSDVEMIEPPYVEPPMVEEEQPKVPAKAGRKKAASKKRGPSKRASAASTVSSVVDREMDSEVQIIEPPYVEPPVEEEELARPVEEKPPKAPAKGGRTKAASKKKTTKRVSVASTVSSAVEPQINSDIPMEEEAPYVEPPPVEEEQPKASTRPGRPKAAPRKKAAAKRGSVASTVSNMSTAVPPPKTRVPAKRLSAASTASSMSTRANPTRNATRGTKRTSDGMEKHVVEEVVQVVQVEEEVQVQEDPKHASVDSRKSLSFHSGSMIAGTPGPPPATPPERQRQLTNGPRWSPIDVEAVITQKLEISGLLAGVLVDAGLDKENMEAAGKNPAAIFKAVKAGLTAEEKKMTVREWVLYNAKRGEEKLRLECERMVRAFEEEGQRAIRALEALQTSD